jgi:hypothetical protein
MSAMISLTSAICCLDRSLSSGECSVAKSTSLFWSFNLVDVMAASSSLADSSRRSWSTAFASAFSPSSFVWVTEANSKASESLKWASAITSDSSG